MLIDYLELAENYYINYFLLILSFIYLPSIYYGQIFMKDREFKIKHSLFLWNIFMSFASFYGFYLLLENLNDCDLLNFSNHEKNICRVPLYSKELNQGSLVCFIFCYTKFLEWIDTFFLIIKKRKIIFLHWFHHLITMLYCLHAVNYSTPYDLSGAVFSLVNLFVHTIMYFYFAIKVYKIYVPKILVNSITFLQLSQMFIGMYTIYLSTKCENTLDKNFNGIVFGGGMYLVYIYLFSKVLITSLINFKNNKKII